MAKRNYQHLIVNILGTKPVAYNPDLAKAIGSAKAGILISQLLYWWKKGNNPEWIYKTADEIYEETALSRKEQETAIKVCKKKDILEVKLKGVPPKKHFKLKVNKIVQLVEFNFTQKGNSNSPKGGNQIHPNGENTPENTAKNTTEITTDKAKQSFAGKEINDLIELFKKINPSYQQFYKNKTERAAIARLLKQYGREKLEKIINTLPQIMGKPYAPTITSPWTLEKKMANLILFLQKERSEENNNKPIII